MKAITFKFGNSDLKVRLRATKGVIQIFETLDKYFYSFIIYNYMLYSNPKNRRNRAIMTKID